MSVWPSVFLGIIAAATLTIAIVLVGALVAAGRLARRVERLVEQVDAEIAPLFVHLNAVARDASRAAALAVAQVERADRMFGDVTQKVEQTLSAIQSVVAAPAREGRALMSGFLAALAALRDLRGGRHSRRSSEEEDALFI